MQGGVLGSDGVVHGLSKGSLATRHAVRLGSRSGQNDGLSTRIFTEKLRAGQGTLAVTAEWG